MEIQMDKAMIALSKVLTYEKMQAIFKKKKYTFFDDGDWNLNVFGIRSTAMTVNEFDDVLGVCYKDGGVKVVKLYACTTDPGKFWLQNPLNNAGCAILKEGQYLGAYKIGKHRGEYEALVQVKPVEVYRDDNLDLVFDMSNLSVDKGLFGINIHRSHPLIEVVQVNKHSAGCQVFANPSNFDGFMKICKKASVIRVNSFSYTLLNEKDIV